MDLFSMGSVPKMYNEVRIVQARQWSPEVQLLVGDSHGKFVVEEELEVSLWRLSVWLEDLVTVGLF
jgi:hypothetical protein